MWIKLTLVCIAFSSGLLVSMGVFSVLIAVSLLPRLAGKTGTAKYILCYENLIIFGILVGIILSVFPQSCTTLWNKFRLLITATTKNTTVLFTLWYILQKVFLILYGLFTGIFVGTLAIAIAELLDAIPIFTKRASLKKYLNLSIFFMALGKFAGAIFAYLTGI